MVAWHHYWVFPWESFKIFWDFILNTPSDYFFSIVVFDFLTLIIFTLLLIYSFRRLSLEYHLFVWPTYFLALCQPWDSRFFIPTGSLSRYMFQLFPLVAILGFLGVKNKNIDFLITFFFISLFEPLSLAFFHGLWVE